MANQLYMIKPYLWNGIWVFDDPDVGLVKEPFISGIPEIIEEATKSINDPDQGFVLLFSAHPFPGHSVELKLTREEHGGYWYKWEKTGQEGWLRPALNRYFALPPFNLYIKVKASKWPVSKAKVDVLTQR